MGADIDWPDLWELYFTVFSFWESDHSRFFKILKDLSIAIYYLSQPRAVIYSYLAKPTSRLK